MKNIIGFKGRKYTHLLFQLFLLAGLVGLSSIAAHSDGSGKNAIQFVNGPAGPQTCAGFEVGPIPCTVPNVRKNQPVADTPNTSNPATGTFGISCGTYTTPDGDIVPCDAQIYNPMNE